MEIPMDLINHTQISLRRIANLPFYDPNDSSFSDFPSPEQAVAALDSAAENLRCRHCKAVLLRSSESLYCVFCGEETFNALVAVPEPIGFKNTLGFRWLLESLDLDGSELVPVVVESNKRSRGRPETSNEITLSELLDLEIKWPSELEKFGTGGLFKDKPVQSQVPVNSTSVNSENFFPSEESSLSISQPQTIEKNPVQNNLTLFESAHKSGTENSKESIQAQHNTDLFDNAQPSHTASQSTGNEIRYLDSDWGENFQSAPSGGANLELKSFDPFEGSTDLSAQLDEVFGPAKESSSHKKGVSDWFSDNSWDNSNLSSSGLSQDIRVDTSQNNSSAVENLNLVVDWVPNTIGNNDNTKENDKHKEEGDDSFGDWNDFASSTTAQDPFKSWNQTTVPSEDKSSELNLFVAVNQPNNTKPVDIFLQQDLLLGDFSGSKDSVLDRTADEYAKAGVNSDVVNEGTDFFGVETTFKPNDVEKILSQMNDLSFMRDSDLSVPLTQDGTNSSSRN